MNNPATTVLQQHFELPIDPFAPGALPEFFFVGAQRRFLAQRVVHALYFSGGVVVLSGARGVGKTKVIDQVVGDLHELSDSCRIEANVMMDAAEIRRLVASRLGLSAAAAQSSAALVAAFAQWQPAGREPQPIVLIIDDAQLLAIPVLTECLVLARSAGGRLRLLLVGEPELMTAWQQSDGGAAEFIELQPLDRQECADYVLTRLQAAGYRGATPLAEPQWRELYEQSHGNIAAIHTLLPNLLERQNSTQAGASKLAAALQNLPLRYIGLGVALVAIIVVPMFFHSADKPPAQPAASTPANQSAQQRSVALTLPLTAAPPAAAPAQSVREPATTEKPVALALQTITPTTKPAVVPPIPTSSGTQSAANIKPSAPLQAPVVPKEVPKEAAKEATQEAAKKEAAKEIANVASDRQLSADESELLAAPAQQVMLQLMGAESPATAAKFVADRANGLKLYVYRTRHKDRPWNIVVMGPYVDRNAALAAIATLPPALSAQKPWPRSLASVQAEIRARH